MKALISKQQLQYLLNRTIRFLGKLRHISITAVADISILKTIEKKLFGFVTMSYDTPKTEIASHHASFSSDH